MNLNLLVGISGSGKSTWAKAIQDKNSALIVLCPDILRGIVGSGEEDQTVNGFVFNVVRAMTEYFLKSGKDVIIDATNVRKVNRQEFIDIGHKHGAKVCAYVFRVPLEVCLERNFKRARRVPPEIIQRQFDNYVPPQPGEFDEVVFID